MKKHFFAIYFIIFSLSAGIANASPREIVNIEEAQHIKNSRKVMLQQGRPEMPKTRDELIKLINAENRVIPVTSMDDMEKYSGMSVVHSEDYLAQQAQDAKSTFQKIYEETMSKISLDEQDLPEHIAFSDQPSDRQLYSELSLQQALSNPEKTDFEVINVNLPNGKTIVSPAKEHIPYLSSIIEIMPDGLVRIRETVTVIANAQKLKYGLIKALPKYSTSREGVKESTIPYLNKVTINGTDVDYILKDAYDRFLITPRKSLPLQPGIYTYVFDYILDRKLWYYDNFNEFYWDITGSFWNLAVNYATAVVRLPADIASIGETLMLGYLPDKLSEEGGIIVANKVNNALGFVGMRPLFAGEGMHILIQIPKKGFIDPDINKKIKWFIEDYGDIMLAAFAFLAILLAYVISWKFIDASSAEAAKINFKKTPALLRMLAKGVYDKVSFGAFLLDLRKKGIIDIIEEDKGISLIKRTNKLSKLNAFEKKAIKAIFANKQNSLSISPRSSIVLNKASHYIEKDTNKRIKRLLLRLNFSYVFLSSLMLILSELAIAYLKVDMWSVFGILLASTVTMAFYWSFFMIKINNKFLRFILRLLAFVLIVFSGLMMSNHVHIVTVLFIIAMIYTIFKYGALFSKRDGLIRHNVSEAKKLAQQLKNNVQSIILGNQFDMQQANIFALEAGDNYKDLPELGSLSKINLVNKIIGYCG